MHNKLLKQKNNISVSALVGEENTAQERALKKILLNFFVLSMCSSLNKAIFHFGSLVWRPKHSHKLNAKPDTFSKLPYKSCCDAVKYLFVSSF